MKINKLVFFSAFLLLNIILLFNSEKTEAQEALECWKQKQMYEQAKSNRYGEQDMDCYCPDPNAKTVPICTKKFTASPPAGGYYGGSRNLQMQIMQSILQPFFNSLFALPDTSGQDDEIERQNAIKRQQEEEQKRQATEQAKKRWLQLQNEEARERQMKQEDGIMRGKEMLSQMQTVGGGDKQLEPFSFGNPKLDLKPLSQDPYPTAHFTEWERLLCSAYFSNMAKQSTNNVDVKFYADQAQRVMSGEPTYLECRIPQVSNEKLAKRMKKVKKVYDEMNVKIKDLQDIETKLTEKREKTKDAEIKKEEATAKLTEIQNRAATASPEEKAEMDDLVHQAQEQSQIADQHLNQAKQSENDEIKKKEKTENEIKNMNVKIQEGSE